MNAPPEYIEAVNLYRLCESYHALPGPGGVLDQDVALLRMHAILGEGGYFPQEPVPSSDPLAGLPMEAL